MTTTLETPTRPKYQPYPDYRDSGVEWLGEIPAHWEMKRLKYKSLINSKVLPETTRPDYEITYIDIASVNSDGTLNGLQTMLFDGAPSRARRIVSDGDVLISTVRTYLRAITYIQSASPGLTASTGFAVVTPSRPYDPKFLYYWSSSKAFVEQIVARSVGVSYPAINASEIGNLEIPEIDLPEQTAIANFLDCETAKIDALIEKKRRLIELLEEKRTALISHAVTKGLDPNAQMKDSGVEWLGEIPAHWECVRAGYLARLVRGASPRPAGRPEYFNGNAAPWITVAEITKDDDKYLTSTESRLTDEGERLSRRLPIGVMVLSNSGATLGVPKILKISGCINDGSVAFLDLQKKVDLDFLYYFFRSMTNNYRERIKQGSGQPNLNTDIVKSTYVSVPPISEQQVISEYLNQEFKAFSLVAQKIQGAIDKLREYRTALISAAVTGKIDVRGEVA